MDPCFGASFFTFDCCTLGCGKITEKYCLCNLCYLCSCWTETNLSQKGLTWSRYYSKSFTAEHSCLYTDHQTGSAWFDWCTQWRTRASHQMSTLPLCTPRCLLISHTNMYHINHLSQWFSQSLWTSAAAIYGIFLQHRVDWTMLIYVYLQHSQ